MKGLFIVAAFAVVGISMAACANHCSGHGKCIADDKCSCFIRYTGADCSQRKCKENYAWADGSTSDAHEFAECSNKGVCDRATGECMCYPGYEGAACQRSECPNGCSGHGTCESLNTLSGGYSGTFWDLNKIQGCKCDPWWSGFDCSLRQCPRGDDPLTACPAPNAGEGQCNGQVWTVKYEQFSDARYTKRSAVVKKNVHWLVQDLYGEWYASRSFLVGDPNEGSPAATNDLLNGAENEARAALEDMDWWVSFATTDPFEFIDDTVHADGVATQLTFTMRLKNPKRINTIRLITDACEDAGCYPLQPTGQTDSDYTLTSSFVGDHPAAAAQVTELTFPADLSVTAADFQSKYIEVTDADGIQIAVWFEPAATAAATTLGPPVEILAGTAATREIATFTAAATAGFADGQAADGTYLEITDYTGREFAVYIDIGTDLGAAPAGVTAEAADTAALTAIDNSNEAAIATDIKDAFEGITGFTDAFYSDISGNDWVVTSKVPGFDLTDAATDMGGGNGAFVVVDGSPTDGSGTRIIDSAAVAVGATAATVATQVQTKLDQANTDASAGVTVTVLDDTNVVRITNDAEGAAPYVYTTLSTDVVTVTRTTTGATAEVDESTGTAAVYTLVPQNNADDGGAGGEYNEVYVQVKTLDGREFAVWTDVDDDATWAAMPTAITADPTDIARATGIANGAAPSVTAAAIEAAFDTLTDFAKYFSISVSGDTITITHHGAGAGSLPTSDEADLTITATTAGVAKTATTAGAEDLYAVAESDVCSNRGICDESVGKCQCFEGYTGVACEDQTILV